MVTIASVLLDLLVSESYLEVFFLGVKVAFYLKEQYVNIAPFILFRK